tara:strand:- start:678 stop:2003 length:1326 start_codon:yes stop_codon:yes gene_type:complete
MKKNKDIVLVVGNISKSVAQTVLDFQEMYGHKLRFALMQASAPQTDDAQAIFDMFDITMVVNFDSPKSIMKALLPYQDQLLVATCRSEAWIPEFGKVVPHIPYLKTPTAQSLQWAVDKLEMRRRFTAYDRSITPKYTKVTDSKKASIEKIEEKIGYPLVVKPTGLAQSLLVTIAYHREELEQALKTIFRKIKTLNQSYKGNEEPRVLVEQFLEGNMYSVDLYVNSRGHVYFCPLVSVKTGIQVGFDDFFGYQQMTPTKLKKESIEEAQEVAEKSIHALGLRSTTAHVELMRTETGWKVIEVGPRIGGFRHNMYELSYGIDHAVNDLLIRLPKKPHIPKKILGYTAVFKFFAKKEGKITNLTGIKKMQTLKSFYSVSINKKVGERAESAAKGGKSIFNVTMFNEDRSKLLADIRRMEKMVNINTSTTNGKAKPKKTKTKKRT